MAALTLAVERLAAATVLTCHGALVAASAMQLETALSQLSSQQRQCLILRAQGFRYEEIAKILRITSSNVAQSLRRGIKKVAGLNHE